MEASQLVSSSSVILAVSVRQVSLKSTHEHRVGLLLCCNVCFENFVPTHYMRHGLLNARLTFRFLNSLFQILLPDTVQTTDTKLYASASLFAVTPGDAFYENGYQQYSRKLWGRT